MRGAVTPRLTELPGFRLKGMRTHSTPAVRQKCVPRTLSCPTRSFRALFVQYDAQVGGSPISGAMVVGALVDAGWQIDAVFASDGPMIRRYEELGCRAHVLAHGQWLRGGSAWRRARRWGRELGATGRFVRLMRRLKPDLVYVNTITGLAAVTAARLLRVPSVWHIRELFDDVGGEMHAPLGGKALARWAVARLPSRVVVISEAVAENVLGGRQSPQVAVIPNAVGPRFFEEQRSAAECRAMFGLPTGVPLIGVPGTLRPVKGHEFFFAAARRVGETSPECRFAVTGAGPADYRARLEAQATEAGLCDRTYFLGPVADMPAFYRACDVICVPSRSEPFGRTVIEAFAVGTPVVATAVGGMRETIKHEKTGLLVDYGDAEGLSAALLRVLADRALACRPASAGRDHALECYREELYQDRIGRLVEGPVGQK